MSQRFIRCLHCGLPHDVMQAVCPATGKTIDRRRLVTGAIPAPSQGRIPVAQRPRSDPPPPARPPIQPIGMAASASTIPPPKTGRQLTGKTIGGKYLVRAVLGEGGMGTVFEAENLAIGRSVAVKVLHPSQARKKIAVKRFHQEARAAGAIGHPNICEVYDLGTLDDGSPYLVMEKLVGETLADRIASEGGLPFDDVIDVLTQVLSGLVAAHEKGIVHRDIKPENIFLTKRVGCPPVAKLLDFGVSKMISPVLSGEREEDLDLTRTGMVMGTPFYMSPEQARGDRNLDARVDLWACGVILYEALTGRRPFTAANYNALLLQILTTSPRPARELRPALPQGFDEVIEKSMARSRDDRFQTAAEFQRELQSLRDRYPKTSVGMNVAELARQAALLRGSKSRITPAPFASPSQSKVPVAPPAGAPPPIVAIPPGPPPRRAGVAARVEPEPPRYAPEPTPSSVEIPVLFSETPMSGEQLPAMGTGPAEIVGTGDVELLPASAPLMEEDPATEVGDGPHEPHEMGSDSDTTERRLDLAHLSFGKRPRAGNLRAPRRPEFKESDTDRDVRFRPETEPGRRPEFRAADTEVDDNNATLVQPSPAALSALLRPAKKPPSPDDTVRMDADAASDARDAAPPSPAAPSPRAPKLPR